jgi:autotransporter-associated beta strand protein
LDGQNGPNTAAGRYVRLDLNGFNQTLAGLTTVVRGARRDQGIINGSATPATLTVNNATDYTFTGQLGSGGLTPNFGLTKDGVGKLTLNPRNLNGAGAVLNLRYTGPTTINNGVLEIANNGQLGNGNYATNISIASGAGLVFSGTRTNTLSGVISGDGSLTNSGTGTVTISGTDAVASTVVQNGGVIAIAGGGKVRSLTVDASTVSLPGAGAGTVTNLTFANTGTMNFNVASGGALVCPVADGITNSGGAGSITVNITGSVPASGTYTLIAYAGSLQGSGDSAYLLGTTPLGTYTLTNTPGAVQVIVVSPVLIWTGAQSSEWSQNTIAGSKNWMLTDSPIDYVDGSLVLFDDTTTSNLVDISVADVWPTDVIFNNTTNAYTLQGTYAIAGSTPLTKNGTNTLTILNNNSYSGETTINAGVVQVGNGGASGALGSGDILNNGGLEFNRSDDIWVANLISGTGTLTKKGTNMLTIFSANTCTGDTTVNNGTLILQGTGFSGGARNYSIAAGAVLNLDSTGPAFGTSRISGSGKLLITGQVKNTFATGRRIEISLASSALIEVPLGATLGNGNNNSLIWNNNLAPMSLDGNFELQNVNTVWDALTGSGTIDNPSFGNANQFAATVTVGIAGGSGTFNGPIMNTTATTKISLTKAGAGAQTFTGSLDYRGATTVNAGTMALSGSGSINISPTINVVTNATLDVTGRTDGTLTVNATQTLMGGGTVLGMVNNLGTLAPGASIGTLTIGGNLALDGTSTTRFEVNGSTPANDVVQLGAGVTYGGVLQIVPSGTFNAGQTFTLFIGAGATNAGNFASITGSPGTGKAFSFTNGVLSVVATGPSGPATLTNSVSGGVLSLAWPAGQGWRLESQTNALTVGLGTNWVEAADSSVSSTNITIDTAQPTVFYRLVYP